MKIIIKRNFDSSGLTVKNDKKELLYTITFGECDNNECWGTLERLYDLDGNEIANVHSTLHNTEPNYFIYVGGEKIGCMTAKSKGLNAQYCVDYLGWVVDTDFMDHNLKIRDKDGKLVGKIKRSLISITEHLEIEIEPEHLLDVIYLVMAIDASASEMYVEIT